MSIELEYDYEGTTAAMDIFSQDDIDELQKWTQKLDVSKCIPKDLSSKQLVFFYNACYGDMKKTKICIEKYYMSRKNAPEMFDNRYLQCEDLKQAAQVLEFSVLPGKSREGYDILFHRLYETEPSRYSLEAGCKMLFMTVDLCLTKRGPQPGYMMLFDMRGVKLGHLTRVSLGSLRKFFTYVQEAMPVRMRAIHVMNTEPILDKLMLLIRPFMDKKFFDMIKFHNKNEDLEPFYETVISRDVLPPDFGGTLADTQTLHKKNLQALQLLEPYFRAEQEQRINALPEKKRDHAMQKAFKNLEID